MKNYLLLLIVVLLGAGCLDAGYQMTSPALPIDAISMSREPVTVRPESDAHTEVVWPLPNHVLSGHVVRKGFGQYVEDRFQGYHVGLDLEVLNENMTPKQASEIPVFAIADGTVRYKDWVKGYGGVMVIEHKFANGTRYVIYGHIDVQSTRLVPGIDVSKGNWIAYLGEQKTTETDGERQHLHFAIYDDPNGGIHLQGYERRREDVLNWINPLSFMTELGAQVETFRDKQFVEYVAGYPSDVSDQFKIDFAYPETWGVEYVPSLNAINVYNLYGEGTARERSEIFIRFFDAYDFFTLSTVTIHSVENRTVGEQRYTARRYDIEKKNGVADFADQPSWRNARHIVTDFRGQEGRTRYYVVAANPELDPEVYEKILRSFKITDKRPQ